MGTGDNRYGFYAERWGQPQGRRKFGTSPGTLTALFPVSPFSRVQRRKEICCQLARLELQDWIPVLLTSGPVLSLPQRAASYQAPPRPPSHEPTNDLFELRADGLGASKFWPAELPRVRLSP